MNANSDSIAVIGLGYVGLPLAVEFASQRPVVGFDISDSRIDALRSGRDDTLEVSPQELSAASHLSFSSDAEDLRSCSIFIVTVPTPITDSKQPDLGPLRKASETVGKVMPKGSIIIYESTVYPGCTEEYCVPVLERVSGMTFNTDFFVGYSPERINPGDRQHRLADIVKVTSGSTPATADTVDALYRSIIKAGTHKASSVRVAEAAKVIENTQRDLNIALMNELSVIFNRLNIDTAEVLEAASTKWNFLRFTPGLVGGHCIGVDPYYLTHKAQAVGYQPEVILSGRRINDSMGEYVASQVVKLMLGKAINVAEARVLVLGLAFKENCPDIRNTKVVDVVKALHGYSVAVDIHDPMVNPNEVRHEYGLDCMKNEPKTGAYDAVILAVAHSDFVSRGVDYVKRFGRDNCVTYDVKSVFGRHEVDGRL